MFIFFRLPGTVILQGWSETHPRQVDTCPKIYLFINTFNICTPKTLLKNNLFELKLFIFFLFIVRLYLFTILFVLNTKTYSIYSRYSLVQSFPKNVNSFSLTLLSSDKRVSLSAAISMKACGSRICLFSHSRTQLLGLIYL